jgi:predicted lipoprotein with Yx(FWY)xxD motif
MTRTQQLAPSPAARNSWPRLGLRLAGAGLLVATGAMHLDLYLTGFKNIPTIGVLFLLQVIAAFALALVVAATGSRLFAGAGSLFALSTLGGYLLSIWVGLFGFTEVRTTAGTVAGIIEVAAFAALTTYTLMPGGAQARGIDGLADRLTAPIRQIRGGTVAAAGGISVVALILLFAAVATAGGSSAPSAAAGALRAEAVGGAKVLANSKGLTLYWFAPDTRTASKCYGSCAAYWPPVKGPATAGPGIGGKLGTVKRNDGTLQATYNGHPLYTYVADGAPGQAKGNKLNLNGGLWYDISVK